MGVSLAASRKRDARTGHSAHSASLHQYPAQSNRASYPLVRKAILHLDDTARPMAFSESEQSKNGAGGMVPLYAARVQDLGPDDVAVFQCGASGTLGAMAEPPDRRAWAAADRQGARPGTAAAGSAVRRGRTSRRGGPRGR